MNVIALSAIKKSIAHHERLRAGNIQPGEALYGASCALCLTYYCDVCPVACRSGLLQCRGTPYERLRAHVDTVHPERDAVPDPNCPVCIMYETLEIEFLESLLIEFLESLLEDYAGSASS